VKKFILILLSLTLPASAQQYNVPFKPQASESFTVYTETDCQPSGPGAGWTQCGDTGSEWIDGGTDCNANISTNYDNVCMVDTDGVDSTDNFGSMQVTGIGNNQAWAGFVFRATGTPGNHYEIRFNNDGASYNFESKDLNHDTNTACNGDSGNCGCGAYVDINAGDYISVTITGTDTSTAVSWWDHGATPPSDLQDPDTWGTATCECSAAEIVANCTFDTDATYLDTAGNCGMMAISTTTAAKEVDADTMACGDF